MTTMTGQLDALEALFAQEHGLPELTLHHSNHNDTCALCRKPTAPIHRAFSQYVCTDKTRGQADPHGTAWAILRVCKPCAKKHNDLDQVQEQIDAGTRPYVMGDRHPTAPLDFTTQEFHPDQFDYAAPCYRSWVGDEFRMYRGWHETRTGRNAYGTPHPTVMYYADLRCNHYRTDCYCVGDLYYRAYCVGCEWWTPITDGENIAAGLILDHCWPGWRDLPTVESKPNAKFGYDFALPADYPAEWQVPGAPVKECRDNTKTGTRHVPSRSPWGGYATAVTRECEAHQ